MGFSSSAAVSGLALVLSAGTAHADDTAPVSDVAAAPAITVVGKGEKAKPVSAGILGNRSVLDTPFTVSAVSADDIANLQTKDINGAFRSDASVTEVNSSLAAASGAQFRVRGVALDQLNSFKLDGLALPYWSIDLPIEQFDQIQLFKGATGFMYGFGSPAGVINFVTRRPTDGFVFNADAGYRSDTLFSGHIDAGNRSSDGRFGWRLNLQGEDGRIYNGGYNRNYSADLALEYRLTDRLTWSADGFYMNTRQTDQVNTVSVAAAVTSLAPVDGRTNLAAKGTWKTNEMGVGTTGLDWQISDSWSAKLRYRWSKLDENYPGNLITIANNAGDYTASAFFVQRVFDFDQVQATANGKFTTGPIAHDLVLGAEYEVQGHWSDTQSLAVHPIGSGNIYTSPTTTLAAYPTSNYHPVLYELNHYVQKSLFGADTLTLGRFSLLLGLRYTDYSDTVDGPNQQVAAIYRAKPVSPTVALTWKAAEHVRAYVSYVQGLQNGGQAGTTNVNNGQTFGPIHTTQYEAGVKVDQRRWNAALAFFRTTQDAAYVTQDNYYVQSGQGRYQGVEVSASLHPDAQWLLSGAVSYIDATYLNEGPVYTGKQVPGAPSVQFTLGGTYSPSWFKGASVNANVKYVGDGYGNTLNTLRFGAYATADAGVAYGFDAHGHHITLRAGVKNLTDTRYWAYSSSTVIPGEPRTVVAGVHFGF